MCACELLPYAIYKIRLSDQICLPFFPAWLDLEIHLSCHKTTSIAKVLQYKREGKWKQIRFDFIKKIKKGPTLTNANGRIDAYYAFPIVTISKEKGSPIVKDTFKLATFALLQGITCNQVNSKAKKKKIPFIFSRR